MTAAQVLHDDAPPVVGAGASGARARIRGLALRGEEDTGWGEEEGEEEEEEDEEEEEQEEEEVGEIHDEEEEDEGDDEEEEGAEEGEEGVEDDGNVGRGTASGEVDPETHRAGTSQFKGVYWMKGKGKHLGRAAPVEPMKPLLKPPGTKRLNLKHYKLLSDVAFKFNLRRYTLVAMPRSRLRRRHATTSSRPALILYNAETAPLSSRVSPGRGLHSSTTQLNLNRF